MAVKVEYIGKKEDFRWKDGKKFPISLPVKEAKQLIDRNPGVFKSDELVAFIAKLQVNIESDVDGGDFQGNTPDPDENKDEE